MAGAANNVDNQQEGLVDKLRSGEYGEVIAAAQKGHDAQQAAKELTDDKQKSLCLDDRGGITKADPHTHFCKPAVYTAPDPLEKQSYEDELKMLRRERMQAMKQETKWKELGHGEMRELEDEKEFLFAIRPHERAVVLLDDGRASAVDVNDALTRLARRHIESQFCRLNIDKAFFLTQMVKLEGLPAIFIVEEGKVTRQLSPETLFEYSSASSPLFKKHLAAALLRVGAITKCETGDSSAEEDEEEDGYARRQKREIPNGGYIR